MKTLTSKKIEKELKEALEITAKVSKQIRKDFEEFEEKRKKIRKELDSGARRTKGFII